MKRAYALIAILSFFTLTEGQEITVTSAPDTSAMLIGDQRHFIVSASIPEGLDVRLFNVTDTLTQKILILEKSKRDTSFLTGGRITITDRYLITSFDSGTYVIPPIYAEVTSGDSIKRYYSDYSALKVMRPEITPPDTTDVIFDIVPPRKAPLTFREIVPWLIIIAIMAIVIWVLARYLPQSPLKRIMKPAAFAEPAHIVALRDLARLKDEELWQKGEVKEYYSRLSDILRRYIDGRYGIMSPELTTDETVRMLQRSGVLAQGELSLIKEILSLSDMVKFAKYLPQQEIHEKTFDNSVRFVELTREPEKEPEGMNEKKGGADA